MKHLLKHYQKYILNYTFPSFGLIYSEGWHCEKFCIFFSFNISVMMCISCVCVFFFWEMMTGLLLQKIL